MSLPPQEPGGPPPRFPAHWNVSAPELVASTFSSFIWKVRLADGGPAIVKALKPIEDIADGLRGADYLAWRRGRSAVRLLGRDGNQLLLEYAGERTLADVVADRGDGEATRVAAELAVELHATWGEPVPSFLLPLRARFAGLFERAGKDREAGVPTPYVEAAGLVDELLRDAGEACGLHGDLHHGNIMLSDRGWLVIDPVGVAGEAGFGVANMFYDPAGREDLCRDPARIASMADAFSRALHLDPRRLLDQACAYGALSAAWDASAGYTEDEQRTLSIAAVIRRVRGADF
ncbi:MAG TPA: aminoglycoside phosphotransferase family protein [Ramlibacter sp.]|nr:aminoglycoside phosphotransferase family protein [Ramlibacter sp.]